MNILLSVEPRFAEAILSGDKKWEFRTRGFQLRPKKVYIYCTSPVQKIVGFFRIEKTIFGPREKIWKICGKESGITCEEFINRFRNRYVYAMKIAEAKRFIYPVKLSLLRIHTPPRSFVYIGNVFLLRALETQNSLAQKIQHIFGGNGHGFTE
jgi:predicted transcriptional regulator